MWSGSNFHAGLVGQRELVEQVSACAVKPAHLHAAAVSPHTLYNLVQRADGRDVPEVRLADIDDDVDLSLASLRKVVD